jgi:hypothetical protein
MLIAFLPGGWGKMGRSKAVRNRGEESRAELVWNKHRSKPLGTLNPQGVAPPPKRVLIPGCSTASPVWHPSQRREAICFFRGARGSVHRTHHMVSLLNRVRGICPHGQIRIWVLGICARAQTMIWVRGIFPRGEMSYQGRVSTVAVLGLFKFERA